jgi:CBS domain-containing protein
MSSLRIRDVISPTIGVRSNETSAITLDRMRSFGVHHSIVTDPNGIRGVVSEADLARACDLDPDTPVGELAVEVPVVDSESSIREAANLMRSRNVGCVPVVHDDTLAGIVTVEKLLDLIEAGGLQPARRRR